MQPSDDLVMDRSSLVLEKFMLYETRQRFYLIGFDPYKRFFRVLKIDRSDAADLNINEDPVVYSRQEVKSLLKTIAEGNRATGGLRFVTKVFGIAGCIKFLESHYLLLVTKRRQIGSICGHAIYCIDESQLITIPHYTIQSEVAYSKTELRYKKLFSSVDLTKDFFYSYTYPIMHSLQKNVQSKRRTGMPYDNLFVWNSHLTKAIRSRCINNIWTVALVHGHFKQMRMSIFGRDFSVALVSRRSQHFAGARYLKRGVNDEGRVANDVETEQIVLDEDVGSCKGKMSSVVQMRGSIPLFWSQQPSTLSPKPDIILEKYDPTYEATKKHFEDVAERYGNPIIVLNLIKTVEKRPREMMLRREFANAVGYLNQILSEEKQMKFIHWDYHKFAKTNSANVLAVLGAVADDALDYIGFYCSGKPPIVKKRANLLSRTTTTMSDPSFQSGVLRTNCIDCLDRTNVAQYAYGLAALGRQLHAMGITDPPKVDPDSSIAAALMDMYHPMGDALAQQYAGSAAHSTVFPVKQGMWKAAIQSREFLKSIQRYYSNTFTDGEKKDAINLFLGYFKPLEGKPAIWDLDFDYYLHVSGIGDELLPVQSLSEDDIPVEMDNTFHPIPACKEDYSRRKLTSFDKLIERTCSALKSVRLYSEPDRRSSAGTPAVAPDAAEIQLRTPNWIFGKRKSKETDNAPNMNGHEETGEDIMFGLHWLSADDITEEDIFQRYLAMISVNEDNGWFGGTLLGDLDENSEIYKLYAELCQGLSIEPFVKDAEKEQFYASVLRTETVEVTSNEAAEAEMEGYIQIGDLGIFPRCKPLDGDPCQVTRWLVGVDKIHRS